MKKGFENDPGQTLPDSIGEIEGIQDSLSLLDSNLEAYTKAREVCEEYWGGAITLPEGTGLEQGVVEISTVLGPSLKMFSKKENTALDSDVPGLRARAAKAMLGDTYESRLSRLINGQINKRVGKDILIDAIKPVLAHDEEIFERSIEAVWRIAGELSDSSPIVPLEAAESVFSRYDRLRNFPSDQEYELKVDELADLLGGLPNPSTVDYVLTSSFIDVVRFLKISWQRQGVVPVHVDERDDVKVLKEHGVQEKFIILGQAAKITDIAFLGLNEEGRNSDIARLHAIYACAGITSKFGMTLGAAQPLNSIRGRAIQASNKRRLTPQQELLLNAHDNQVMYAKSIKEVVQQVRMLKTLKDGRDAWGGSAESLAQFLSSSLEKEFLDVAPLAGDNCDEAMRLEADCLDAFSARFDEMYKRGFMTSELHQKAKQQLIPRYAIAVQNMRNERELDELGRFHNEKLQSIQVAQQPYEYSSKGIRSFENGPGFLRELCEELDKRDWLRDDDARHMLAMVVLQSQATLDPEHYFSEIKRARNRIERDLGELHFLGFDKQAALTDIFDWIDELVDAGQDELISNRSLKRFIYDYVIGPEVAEDNAEKATHESNEEIDNAETHSSEGEAVQTEEQKQKEHEEAQRLTEEYFTELTELLDEVDLVHADVDVFPPGAGDTTHAKTFEQNSNARPVRVDAARLRGLVGLKKSLEAAGKYVEFAVTNPTKWSKLPYFALFVQDDVHSQSGVCILENPVIGHASYVFNVDGVLIQQWEELAAVSRKEARHDYGAVPRMHPGHGKSHFDQHYQLVLRNMISLGLNELRNN